MNYEPAYLAAPKASTIGMTDPMTKFAETQAAAEFIATVGDDTMLNAIMVASAPRNVTSKHLDIVGPNAQGQFGAFVIQTSWNGAALENQILWSRFFGSEKSARRAGQKEMAA